MSIEQNTQSNLNDAETIDVEQDTVDLYAALGEISRLTDENNALIEEIKKLKSSNKEYLMKSQAGSSVSNNPPSHDLYTKGRSLKEIKKNYYENKNNQTKNIKLNKGKQKGTEGSGRKLVDVNETRVHKCIPSECNKCVHKDDCENNLHRYSTRHVDDIKIITTRDTYELYNCNCPLKNNEKIYGEAPKGVNSSIQFGIIIQVITIVLYFLGMPYERIDTLFKYLLGDFAPSIGTLYNFVKKFGNSETLKKCYDKIYTILSNKHGVLFADETGIRGNKVTFWLHVICDTLFSYCYISKHRGYKAMEEGGTASIAKGNILVHDCWASYFKIDQVLHGLCNAHLIRELFGVFIFYKQQWAYDLITLLLDIYEAKKYAMECGLKRFSQAVIDGYKEKIKQLVDIGIKENPLAEDQKDKKRPKRSKPLNLAMRISTRLDNFLAFVENFDIPFTNNIAEQTIRSAKIKIKNAGYLEQDGAKMYAKIYSVLNTVHKQNGSVCDAIKNICSGEELKFTEYV